jgi:hypothetical protein
MVGSTSLPVSSENSQGLDHFIDVFGLHKSLVLIIGNDKNAKKARLPNYDKGLFLWLRPHEMW